MGDPRPLARPLLWLVAFALAACAGPVPLPPAVAPRPPLSVADMHVIAALLELEDGRDYQADLLDAAAISAEPSIRVRAALASARIGAPPSRALARAALSDPDSAVAATAAFALGHLLDGAATPDLLVLLDTISARLRPTVAAEAAEALGKIGASEGRTALTTLLSMADTADPALTRAVTAALMGAWRIGQIPTATLARWFAADDADVRWRAAFALTRPGRPDAVGLLLPRLDDSDALVRAVSLRGLTRATVIASGVMEDIVLARVIAALDDEAYQVRVQAIRALGSYPQPIAIEALQQRLQTDRPHEVVAAIESLGWMGPGAAIAADPIRLLVERVETPTFIREVGIEALAALQPADAPTLFRNLRLDPSWRVRAALARALGAAGGPAHLADLELLVRDSDPRVATAALQAVVSGFGSTSLALIRPLLLESLQAADLHVRAAASTGLAALADPATFPALLDAYETAQWDSQNDAAVAAIDAIAALGVAGTLSPERAFFARFQRSDDYLVRRHALLRFRDAARSAWGDPLPIERTTDVESYRAYVEQWIGPASADRGVAHVRIDTEEGPIDVVLFAADAPLTVASFLQLTRARYFDDQEWPRVVPDFVIQGGDPRGDTSGGPGYSIRDEIGRHRFLTGSLGMAHAGPDTAGSQFFITYSPQPQLDGAYTVFGRVVAGQDVAERLLPGQRILSIREILDAN